MDNADLMIRLGGGCTVLSGLYNALISAVLFFVLVWVCVGVWFLVPLGLSLVQIGGGISMMVLGSKQKELGFLPIVGIITSMMSLNFTSLVLDITALTVGIIGYTQAQAVRPSKPHPIERRDSGAR